MSPYLLIDTSYSIFYRYYATHRWYHFAHPDDKFDDDYEWFENEVHLLRYKPGSSPIGKHSKLYDPIQYIYEYEDAMDFIKEDMIKEHVTTGPGLNINLSDILTGNLEDIWDSVDTYLGKPINRNWCNKLMQTWRNRWV